MTYEMPTEPTNKEEALIKITELNQELRDANHGNDLANKTTLTKVHTLMARFDISLTELIERKIFLGSGKI